MERFIADYPSSPRRAQALADLGLAYLNLGDKEKSLKYYDMVVETAPQSSEAKGAMQGIREIYVSDGKVDDYFDYAARVGMESDLTAVSRDSLSFAAVDHKRHVAAIALMDQFGIGGILHDLVVVLHRCGDERAAQRGDDGAGYGVVRNADADRTALFKRLVGHARGCREHEREGPRQVPFQDPERSVVHTAILRHLGHIPEDHRKSLGILTLHPP